MQNYSKIVGKININQRLRPNLQLSTGFHCTRVKSLTAHDWAKLVWLLEHSWRTLCLPLTMETDDDGNFCVCVDGAHVEHADGKGCSGLHVTMGKGSMMNASRKLGLVTNSSTETEVVPCGERLPKCAWFMHFRMAQWDADKEDVLMQDNKSCAMLHKNYLFSIGKGIKHLHARCFFVAEKNEKKEVHKFWFCLCIFSNVSTNFSVHMWLVSNNNTLLFTCLTLLCLIGKDIEHAVIF